MKPLAPSISVGLEVVADLTAFYAVSLLYLSYVGFWCVRLFAPLRLRHDSGLFSPLVGYCVLSIWASALTSSVATLTQATYALLMPATALNLWAVRKTGLPTLPGWSHPQWWVNALVIGAYAVGVLPLVHGGSTAFVGAQWDLEVYLPIVEYLKRYVIGGALVAPANPLLAGMNSATFRGGSGWGFSYFQGAVDILLGWMSYQSFRPALQLAFALSIPAVYLFARHSLRTRPGVALAGAALWSMNGTALWIASAGLAGHAISFMTIPLALCLTLTALRAQPGAMVLAGIALSGMLLSYYTGAAFVYVVTAVALILPMLIHPRPRRRCVRAVLGILAAVLLFAFVGHLRFLGALSVYETMGFSSGWHSAVYIPLSEALGLLPDAFVAVQTQATSMMGGVLAPLADGGAFLLTQAVVALCLTATAGRGWHGGRFLCLCLGAGAAAIFLRFVAHYPYGYFKLLTLAAFLYPIALAQGIWRLWSGRINAPRHRSAAAAWAHPFVAAFQSPAGRICIGAAGGCFCALLALNLFLSLRFFWAAPDALHRSVWELSALHGYLPPGAAVRVAANGELSPQESAMLAYFLLDNPMVGVVHTAYGDLVTDATLKPPRYWIVASRGDATLPAGARRLWSNALVSLYDVPDAPPIVNALRHATIAPPEHAAVAGAALPDGER